ncbi:hypothetical protein NTD86_16555 [Pseudomonas sp. 7P_10.2_Bac1]|uniref:hypothetical protein n=1 Tax=Pseudomonas sp. 7P_10.2_Bac1 TaxID=2971614 RepID=UPI0021C8A137|nr:hypothetical protein [Pseudomonas sp. 7P_10.2_Bac1]MCU1728596.1 hypothetical protein [Pseudomonas sp. 7P_10.2_Bac1]
MTIDDIQRLIQRLEGSSITSFVHEDASYSLSLEFGAIDATLEVATPVLLAPPISIEQCTDIKSPAMGIFYHHHPFTEGMTDLSGHSVTPDMIIGYVVVDTQAIPIYPPTSGTLKSYSIGTAHVVGYGDIIATLF